MLANTDMWAPAHARPLFQLAGMYHDHILFVERSEKKSRIQIHDITTMSSRLININHDFAVLSVDGNHLLVGSGETFCHYCIGIRSSNNPFRRYALHLGHPDGEGREAIP